MNNEDLRINFESGLQIVKMLFLANGGAVIAMLTLFGTIWNKGIPNNILTVLAQSTFCFCMGLFFAIICTISAYGSNVLQTLQKCNKLKGLLILSMLSAGAISPIAFLIGVYKAYSAFLTLFS
ncbi:hypothetical protein ACLO93_14235 [Proteus mirabilis]|uniref:hypothetical protein n=1 Tax=Proteus TaxID=583 RepID=UPI00040844FB|nr:MULTISPECIES: hypothetical protein [Proteus]NBN61585.1 hypothetical protein [Proteus sp. G2639]EKU5911992.1 hypothetical protein [Proteus mirabilis]EKV6230398.1 hypothetical protein [Proteus mirabilis]ELB1102633.1 hypothetical protein [Proteus mirabilis]ELW9236147.1 hypothetical protein [Proteus mirabilis]